MIMKVSDILKIEKENTSSIFLIKEGIFWRAYELSAFLFVENIKKYEPTKKYIKIANQEIVFIGFPDNILELILSLVSHNIHKQESIIEIQGFKNTTGFEKWKSDIPLKPKSANHKIISSSHYYIIEKIKNYPLANKTPIETFEFLSKIQNEINGNI